MSSAAIIILSSSSIGGYIDNICGSIVEASILSASESYFLKFSACSKISLNTSSCGTGGYPCSAKIKIKSICNSALMSERFAQSVYFDLSSTIFFTAAARVSNLSSGYSKPNLWAMSFRIS